MKTIIFGSRTIRMSNEELQNIIHLSQLNVTEIISGCADGIDNDAIRYAIALDIPCLKFPANWKDFGRAAGVIRNSKMVEEADAAIGIWDGRSKGTLDTINKAIKKKIPLFIYRTSGSPKTEKFNY